VFWSVAAALLLLVATPIGTPITPQLLSDGQYLARVVLHPLIAVALIAPMAFPQARPGRLRAFLGSPVMRFLGRISFGIFLWHSIVIEAWDRLTHQPLYSFDFWTLFTVTVAGTLVMATLSYYLIEKPAQRLANVGRS
jgi:peptidoglycan/LPS O-acetylase OafA/YrhL